MNEQTTRKKEDTERTKDVKTTKDRQTDRMNKISKYRGNQRENNNKMIERQTEQTK